MNKQIKNLREKDIKNLSEQVKTYKEKAEEEESKVEENRRTINSLNEYLSDLKKVNKDLINGKDRSERQKERNSNERNEMEEQIYNTHQKKVEIYVGNIDDEIEETDLRTIFDDDDAKITIKRKERKPTRVRCKNEDDCRYGHSCKFIHMKELQESIKYAIIEVNENKKDDILKYDGEVIGGNEIIVEERKNPNIIDNNKGMKRSICKYYKEGRCNRGIECWFEHPKECMFYKKTGNCRFGEQCKYVHLNNNNNNIRRPNVSNLGVMEGMMRNMMKFLPQQQFLPQHIFPQTVPPI